MKICCGSGVVYITDKRTTAVDIIQLWTLVGCNNISVTDVGQLGWVEGHHADLKRFQLE